MERGYLGPRGRGKIKERGDLDSREKMENWGEMRGKWGINGVSTTTLFVKEHNMMLNKDTDLTPFCT